MIGISAQVSLYPLGQVDIAPAIQAVLDVLKKHDLPHEVGGMSTLVWGDDREVFDALREAFEVAAGHGAAVMMVTLSNACPVPNAQAGGADDE